MQAWRIGKAGNVSELTGAGAALYGGRWNHPDHPALYLGLSTASCALDTFMLAGHVPCLPLKLVELQLPDDPALYKEPNLQQLPEGWDALPADKASMDFGTTWLERTEHLGLILPSATMDQTRCLMINPKHPAMKQVTIVQSTDFIYGLARARVAY
jgi:RES domain-containing protein